MGKAILSLSGGMDSTTVLTWLLKNHIQVYPVQFQYGSKHNPYEADAVKKVIEHYQDHICMNDLTTIDISGAMKNFKSNLLKSGGDIPDGHYEDKTMSQTVVPSRNIIFLSILSGFAWSVGASHIALGIHQGDHCLPADELVHTSTGKKPISELKAGDMVLSYSTEDMSISYQRVKRLVCHGHRKDIFQIETKGGRTIRCTSDHKIFRVDRKWINHHKGYDKTISKVYARDLQVGEFLISPCQKRSLLGIDPISKTIDLLPYCDQKNPLLRFDSTHIWFKQKNKVNRYVNSRDVVGLLAWFITEGCRGSGDTHNANTYRVGISQSSDAHPENREEIASLARSWGYTPGMGKNTIWFSGPTTKIFELCGGLSKTKKIPEEFFLLHPKFLFETMMKGDGHFITEDQSAYTTNSWELKEQMAWLGTSLGYTCGASRNSASNCYQLQFHRGIGKKHNVVGDGKIHEIVSITKCSPGLVFDIEVENNHNFFAGEGGGLLVSNCIYEDCRKEFFKAMDTAIYLGTGNRVEILAPFVGTDKGGIAKYGLENGTPYLLTRTCYKDQPVACGTCGACCERAHAFGSNNSHDPIDYADIRAHHSYWMMGKENSNG